MAKAARNDDAETSPPGAAVEMIVSRRQIARRVARLAGQIADRYAGCEELTMLAVLNGSLMFLADLMRRLPLRVRVEVAHVVSYPGSARRSCGPRLTVPLPDSLAGRDVLVVDDILDSGQTLAMLLAELRRRGPGSLRTCVLARKDRPDLPDRPGADFVGFDVPDAFVVGYGLDHDGLYRNLPDLCVLRDGGPEETRP